MTRRPNLLRSPSLVLVLLFLGLFISPSLAKQPSPPNKASAPNQAPRPTSVLLIDTDDSCRLMIDDEDKGVISPDHSQKFKITIGEHILKCTVETVPDLVWRKVVEVKDTSQVAAVISLKALHVQYSQAVTKVKTQKEEADAASAKQMQEAIAAKKQQSDAEKQREQEKAELPQKIFDLVSGSWHGQENQVREGKFYSTGRRFRFDRIEGGLIVGIELGDVRNTQLVMVPVAPNRLVVKTKQCISTKWKKFQKPGAKKDGDGFVACKDDAAYEPGMGVEFFLIRDNNLLEFHPEYENDTEDFGTVTCNLTR